MSKLEVYVERIAEGGITRPFKWWLDFPKNNVLLSEGDSAIDIRGWVFCDDCAEIVVRSGGNVASFALNRDRLDVLKKLEISDDAEGKYRHCGFSHKIPLDDGEIEIGARVGGREFWFSKIKVVASKPVVCGNDDWLFLDNDTNRSVDQFKGELLLTDQVLNAWKRYIELTKVRAETAGARWCLLVAPAKEEVFHDYYPHKRGKVTPIDQFLDSVAGYDEVIFPLRQLSPVRHMSYYSVDTHWSDYGAYLGAVEVAKKLGLEEFSRHLDMPYRVVFTHGDLGGKVLPPKSSPKLVIDYSRVPIKKTFDNGILNTGKVWIYENASAPLQESLILFGDSFSLNLAKQLCNIFSRVVYAHTVALWDGEIVSAEKAKFVVLQTNQRFLISAPTGAGLWDLAKQKVEKLGSAERTALSSSMKTISNSANSYYVTSMRTMLEM